MSPPTVIHPPGYIPPSRPPMQNHTLPAVPMNRNFTPPTRPPMQNQNHRLPMPDDINMTAAAADKELKNLMEGSMNVDIEAEINPEDMIVKSFREKFKLLPHQGLGRVWMKERETGKKAGGILADDMGYLSFPLLIHPAVPEAHAVSRLGKTIQTLARIVDGRARKADSQDGWAASTLYVSEFNLLDINSM